MGCMKSSTSTSPRIPPFLFHKFSFYFMIADTTLGVLPPAISLPALTLISSDPSFATVASNADTLTVASEWAKSLQLAAGLLPNN